MLTAQQLAGLTTLFRHGSDDASVALSRWLGRSGRISVEQVEQIPLGEATTVLGDVDGPICFCAMSLEGRLTGEMILAFDDASGLALADLLLERPVGTAVQWGEVEQSAALETANIIGCAYLNALARSFRETDVGGTDLLPSSPRFARDFAESLMEAALLNQAIASDVVFLTRTAFHIDESPVDCNLLFVPDASSLGTLRELL